MPMELGRIFQQRLTLAAQRLALIGEDGSAEAVRPGDGCAKKCWAICWIPPPTTTSDSYEQRSTASMRDRPMSRKVGFA